jgi:pyrimidine-nucleoside phosphorylase
MNFIEIIKKKRDGLSLNKEEITFSINNYTSGKVPDYQFSAFLMAGFLKWIYKTGNFIPYRSNASQRKSAGSFIN